MSTQAQIAANQANAELSTGPKTEEGKAISSRNNTSHGLTYRTMFFLLPWESAQEYDWLLLDFKREYKPMCLTEAILVERLAQHHWLRNRAELLQSRCFADDGSIDEKRLALFLRYQTTHERAFHKCLADLLKIRAEKRKAEIGFESQKQKKELNEARIRLANARAARAEITQTTPASLPATRQTEKSDGLTPDREAKQAA